MRSASFVGSGPDFATALLDVVVAAEPGIATICACIWGSGSIENPRIAVTSPPGAASGDAENAVCAADELAVNVPRRRKIADGFSLESLGR